MAIYYFLTVECGEKEDQAIDLVNYFENKEISLSDESKVPLSSDYGKDKTDNWWVSIFPKGVSIGSPMGSDYRLYDYFIPEITQGLYRLLKEAPPFRYAIAGHEVEFIVYFQDLKKEIKEDYWEGLITSESLWTELGKPIGFKPFSEGYVWQPFLESTKIGQSYWFDEYVLLKEFKVNDMITLKLENGDSNVFVNNKLILQCKHLLTNRLKSSIVHSEIFRSVDELEELFENTSNYPILGENVPPIDIETEFWGHCSNIQAWAENYYDSNLLDRVLAFPMLRELNRSGDKIASSVFSAEIKKRIKSDYLPVIIYLIEMGYLEHFSDDILDEIIIFLFIFIKKNPIEEQKLIKEKISEAFRNSIYIGESKRDYQLTINILKLALKFNPSNTYALYETGLSYYFLKNYEKAEEFFKKGLNIDHKDEITLGVYSDMLIKQERYNDVIKILKHPIESVSEYSRLLYLLGKAYYKIGNYDGNYDNALKWLNRSFYSKKEKYRKLKHKIIQKLNEKTP